MMANVITLVELEGLLLPSISAVPARLLVVSDFVTHSRIANRET